MAVAFRELFKHWTYQVFAPGTLLRSKYNAFRKLLEFDENCLGLIADLEELYYGNEHADWARVAWLIGKLRRSTDRLIGQLMLMSPTRYMGLPEYFKKIDFYLQMRADLPDPDFGPPYILPLAETAGNPDVAGGKAASLATAAQKTTLNVPDGFVVTANAFSYFLEANELRAWIDKRLRHLVLSKPQELSRRAFEIQEKILSSEIPGEIAREIEARARTLILPGQGLAVRSSAVAEDGDVSFAGQYATYLNVRPENVCEAYRQVLAAKYSPKALTYRLLYGLPDAQTPMAVLVMPMIEPEASGVIYTRDPEHADSKEPLIAIYAVPGPASHLVEGSLTPQVMRMTREKRPRLKREASSVDALTRPILSEEQAGRIAAAALELENLFETPQDIEWALDRKGRLTILQSRRFMQESPPPEYPEVSLPEERVLIADAQRAASGAGCGPACRVEAVFDVAAVPEGSVLVVRTLSPALARAVHKVNAVVAEAGSRASHFASVAREFGLPVLVGAKNALQVIEDGQTVTVDADEGMVLDGCVEALLRRPAPRTPPENILKKRMADIMPLISKLTLTDPEAPEFAPEGCRSMHDFIRFAHEKSVNEMFDLVGKSGRGIGRSRRLETRLPMSMYVLDIGDGLFEKAGSGRTVSPEEFKSVPMWSLWWGLSAPDIKWPTDRMVHADWNELDRVSAGIVGKKSRLLASYAILSSHYMHLILRFGYHFSQVDALCTDNPRQNYISFRFKGGGGHTEQRLLRLEFISRVLETFGFSVQTRGDMLDARHGAADEPTMQKTLAMLGRLLAETRLMDLGLTEADDMKAMAEAFIRRTKR